MEEFLTAIKLECDVNKKVYRNGVLLKHVPLLLLPPRVTKKEFYFSEKSNINQRKKERKKREYGFRI